jgi:hypothetical protein
LATDDVTQINSKKLEIDAKLQTLADDVKKIDKLDAL